MKKLFYLVLIFSSILFFPKCLDDSYYINQPVWLNITDYNFSDTSIVNTPCLINLYTESDNSCIDKLGFLISESDETHYSFFAKATYENSGEACYSLTRTADSSYTLTPSQIGKYYFQFYSIDSIRPIYDTLVVVASRK